LNAGSVPLLLVTGFLGSGKTTFLKRVLEEGACGGRLAVVQNEFAPASVDGEVLRATGREFTLVEINGGSVFCVCLMPSFRSALERLLAEARPETILLEATGLADPIAIAEILQDPALAGRGHLAGILDLVDAASFLDLEPVVPRIAHQVQVADWIVINKIDRNPAAEGAIRDRARRLNPFATIQACSHARFDLGPLLGAIARGGGEPVAMRREAELRGVPRSGRPDIASAAARATGAVPRAALDRFLAGFTPAAVRLKGFVQCDDGKTLAVQWSSGALEIREIPPRAGPSVMIAMGWGLDAGRFVRGFQALFARARGSGQS